MQFWSSALQMVGRLFGIFTTTPDGSATGPLTGMAALALVTAAFASDRASALASLLAFAATAVFAAVCFCTLLSFCSSNHNCCFRSAIS